MRRGCSTGWESATSCASTRWPLTIWLELQGLTGYVRGGVTALAAKRDFPVYVDETIELFDVVSVSAGVRGVQIVIAPGDYLRAVKGTIAALGQPKKQGSV